MQQPPGFEDGCHPQYVCQLQKALYGLKQAPRTWYARLSTKLQELGFVPSRADVSLFVFNKENITIYTLIYVDDIFIASSCGKATDRLIQQLSINFAIKDLGQLSYFLGIEVILKEGELILTQRKYISDLLKKENMLSCKSADTPMSSSDKLSKIQGETLSEPDTFMYLSTVGALQYLALTRPDICFAVNKVCQFIQALTDIHWKVVKRIRRFLKRTMTIGLKIEKSSSMALKTFTDSDWAGCPDDPRSTGGFAIFFGPNLVSWSARKQPTVS